ncbi:MAG: host attachment protein [Ectothiorhodospiraceae bacterium]|nr:host attachment protein [Ectothiorhodospiraceae bacterium]
MKRYLLVADAARARVFCREGLGEVEEVHSLAHPESRLHPGDLEEGGKGEQHESGATSVRQTDKPTDVMDKEADRFAQELAGYMKELRMANKADAFVVAAAPNFLGRLRAKLDDATAKLVEQTVDKDYTRASREEIADKLGV